MESDITLWMNEEELSQVAMEIMNTADSVSEIFSQVNGKMEELGNYFHSPAYSSIMAAYNSLKTNYPTVKSNITTYSDDIITVINKVRSGDKKIVFLIDNVTELAQEAAKIVEK